VAWDVKASAVKLLVVPGSPRDSAEDLVELQHQIEGVLSAMPDATVLDIHVQEHAEGFNAIVFYAEAERPSRGMGFR
jgi:hypothetical protein